MTKMNVHPQRRKSALQRFEEKFVRTEGCWEWTSAIGHRGYGAFWISKDRRCEGAHRYALELKLGHRLPDDLLVMHSCDNPKCVNPDHLSLGTDADNQLDAKRKGRTAIGERNKGGGKLTAKDARFIYDSRFVSKGTQTARRFGVSRYLVNAIRSGKIWRSATQAVQQA